MVLASDKITFSYFNGGIALFPNGLSADTSWKVTYSQKKLTSSSSSDAKFDEVHNKTPAMELLFRYRCRPGFQLNEIHEHFQSGYIIEHLRTTASDSF